MRIISHARAAFDNLFRRDRVERDLDDELRAYIDLLTAEKIRAGLAPAAARRAALVEAGGIGQVKEEVRDILAGARVSAFARDLAHALRGLRRTPGFAVAVVATLTIGIGLNAAVATVAYSILARPLPVRDADRVVNVYQRVQSFGKTGRDVYGNTSFLSYAEFQAYAKAPAFASAAVYHAEDLAVSGATEGAVPSELVSCDYFRTMEARIAFGRAFTSDECARAGSGPVVVLSDAAWRSRYGADPAVVGRVIRVNGLPLTVIGVAEPGFNGVSIQRAAQWIPVTMHPALEHGRDSLFFHYASWLVMAARLAPQATLAEARAQAAVIGYRLDAATPGRVSAAVVTRGAFLNFPEITGEGAVPLALILLLGFTIVAMACANVMGLMLARGLARRREIAIRLAIGASRTQLVQQLLIESGILAFLGAGIGMAFVLALTPVLRALPPAGAPQVDVSPDILVVAYVFIVAVVVTLIAGLTPALQTTGVDLVSAFKGATTFGKRQLRPSRIRSAVVGVQIAGSTMLLVVAALFLRGTLRATSTDPGFATHNVVAFATNAEPLGYDADRANAVYGNLMARIRGTPGVIDVALATRLPLLDSWSGGISLERDADKRAMHIVDLARVSGSYFNTMGMRIVRGTTFDSAAESNQAVISEAMAAKLWPGEDALGKRFDYAGGLTRVVGIASNAAASSLARTDAPIAYLSGRSSLGQQIIVRTTSSPAALVAAVPLWARDLDPELVVQGERFEDRLLKVLMGARVIAAAMASLGAMALLLAAIGVAGVVSFGLGQRRREVAVRLAVGATGRQVVALMMRQGATPIVAGIASGLGLAVVVGQVVHEFLFGVSPLDPAAYVGMIALLAASGALATYLPSRTAATVDPASTLRDEG
jgi:predicted permease